MITDGPDAHNHPQVGQQAAAVVELTTSERWRLHAATGLDTDADAIARRLLEGKDTHVIAVVEEIVRDRMNQAYREGFARRDALDTPAAGTTVDTDGGGSPYAAVPFTGSPDDPF